MIVEDRSIYARKFDMNFLGWTEDREFNKLYLKMVQGYYNELLIARGYVFLRDVYERLGIRPSKESIFVGWYYDPNNATGDNYIDFNIKGEGPDFWLDFNVDGDISNHF